MNTILIAIVTSLLSIGYGIFLTSRVLSKPRGNQQMNDIADAIAEGASAYMLRQYKIVALIGLLILLLIYLTFGSLAAIGFAIGAIFSAVAGIVGMNVAVRSN